MNLNYLLAKPDFIEGIGYIYPIKLKDYDQFSECSSLLYISKNHFKEQEYPLLALIFKSMSLMGYTFEELIDKYEKLFSLILQLPVTFISDDNFDGFVIDDNKIIDMNNYDIIRQIIMKQNLMFEQKVFKDKLVQEWANKALKSKNKNSPNINIEDIVTTISVYSGKHYEDLKEYTIYQLYSDFYRIRKIKDFDRTVEYQCVGAEVPLEDFAESINLFHNPYDDLFVNSNKLNKFGAITK